VPPEFDLLVADARVLQLDHIGLLGPRLACAHAVHVSASDIDRLAATGTVVVRLRAYRRELAA
jgi:cytosine/adenosine deaminase-related metal-dependent hydrolase